MQLGRKIYYELSTGNIILNTGECQGDVIATTADQDFASYAVLNQLVATTVGMMQLPYGQDDDKFGIYNYSINLLTGTIVWGDLIVPNVQPLQPTTFDLQVKISDLQKLVGTLNDNASDLTNFLFTNIPALNQ